MKIRDYVHKLLWETRGIGSGWDAVLWCAGLAGLLAGIAMSGHWFGKWILLASIFCDVAWLMRRFAAIRKEDT